MHLSFFHLKVIVFIHMWFAGCWNNSQATLISLSLILFPFVRLKPGNSVVVSGQIQSITFSDSLCHMPLTPVPRSLYSPVRGLRGNRSHCLAALEWRSACKDRAGHLCSQKSERIFRAPHLNGSHLVLTSLESIQNLFAHFHHIITWMGGLHWSLLADPQPPDPCLHPALCNASGDAGLFWKTEPIMLTEKLFKILFIRANIMK